MKWISVFSNKSLRDKTYYKQLLSIVNSKHKLPGLAAAAGCGTWGWAAAGCAASSWASPPALITGWLFTTTGLSGDIFSAMSWLADDRPPSGAEETVANGRLCSVLSSVIPAAEFPRLSTGWFNGPSLMSTCVPLPTPVSAQKQTPIAHNHILEYTKHNLWVTLTDDASGGQTEQERTHQIY